MSCRPCLMMYADGVAETSPHELNPTLINSTQLNFLVADCCRLGSAGWTTIEVKCSCRPLLAAASGLLWMQLGAIWS